MERYFLSLDDVLESIVYLLSTARNVVGGGGEQASPLFLDCALRQLSVIIDQEGEEAPPILCALKEGIEARRDLLSLDASAYVDSLDDLIRMIARDMLLRNAATSNG